MTEKTYPLCIVGTGKVAQALIRSLHNHMSLCITSPTGERAKAISKKFDIKYSMWNQPLPSKTAIIVRKDRDIKTTSQMIMDFSPHTTEHIHMSGMLSSSILSSPHKCSMHPILSITEDTDLHGTTFAIEGEKDLCIPIIESLDGAFFTISADDKVLYHTALVFISNFTALNTLVGLMLLEKLGIKESNALKGAIQRLINASINNVLEKKEKGLTGPASRGDFSTVQREIEALSGMFRDLYTLQSDVIYRLHNDKGDDEYGTRQGQKEDDHTSV